MPILSGGSGGMAVFIGPTGGYLIAWLFTPLLIGLLIKIATIIADNVNNLVVLLRFNMITLSKTVLLQCYYSY